MSENKRPRYMSFYTRVIKRIFDILSSALLMLLFCWVYAIVAILVRLKLGAPVIFKQERLGKIDPKTGKETVFTLYKFRSMTDKRDAEGNLLPDAERLTKFGRLLRKTSLDELPEAWNIFVGDMSVVGPRPWLVKYLPYYNEFEHRRHLVRPGLTGWAQVNGRNAASWENRFKMDAEYVEKVSLGFDIKTLFLTVKKVITHEGVEFQENHQTIKEYFETRGE